MWFPLLLSERKPELEKRVDAIERGQEIQNGALEDLGQVVSEIAKEEKSNGCILCR